MKCIFAHIMLSLSLCGCASQHIGGESSQRSFQLKGESSQQSPGLEQLEREVFTVVNDYRRSLQLHPLYYSVTIVEYARKHSRNMANKRIDFSHSGYYDRVHSLAALLKGSAAGENIALIQGEEHVAAAALAGWLKSEGHRRLIEENFILTGVGAAVDTLGNYYITHIFWR